MYTSVSLCLRPPWLTPDYKTLHRLQRGYLMRSGLGKIDCNQYSIAIFFTFCSSNSLKLLLFWMSIEYIFTFFLAHLDIPYSILFQVGLPYLTIVYSKNRRYRYVITLFLLINNFCAKKKHIKKKFLIAKLLRINNVIYYVCRLCVSCRMNVRTSQKMLDVLR